MKLKLLMIPAILCAVPCLTNCSSEVFYDLVVYNQDTVIQTSKINIFNNAILPTLDASQYAPGKVFLGFGCNEFVPGVSKKRDFYHEKDLVRFNDVKKYASGKTIRMNTIYCDPQDEPKLYFVLGWYAKTNTSGLSTDIIDGFVPMLKNYMYTTFNLTDSEWEDVEVRAYDGDVATIGGNITFDGDVDIFIGAGSNFGTTGQVTYTDRGSFPTKGAENRFIYQLNDKEVTKTMFSYMRSKEVRTYFGG